jgi:N-acetylneuraminic acid mutarotase
LLYSFICVNIVFAMADTWTRKADFGGVAREGAVGFSIGDKGYIAAGSDRNIGQTYKDLWEYDPATDAWTQKADIPDDDLEGLDLAVAFSIGSKGYIGTGRESTTTSQGVKRFWAYDPAANIWTQKADFGGTQRYSAVGFSIGNKGYIGTGINNSVFLSDFWEYDPDADIWTRKADFGGYGRYSAVGFSIGNKGYLGTGLPASQDLWEYNPAANTWTRKADFGGPRKGAVGFSINGKGYVGAGIYGYLKRTDLWEYDPVAGIWTQKADFGGEGRFQATGFAIGNKGYIGTGLLGNDILGGPVSNDFWEYDAGEGTCTTPPVITSLTASPSALWPPNHKMVNVTLSADVTDACGGDPSPLTTIISVSSNEPAGSDAVANGQAVITGDLTLKLKAERNGNGNGRIYTITVQTYNSYGNIATGTVDVTVPHDSSNAKSQLVQQTTILKSNTTTVKTNTATVKTNTAKVKTNTAKVEKKAVIAKVKETKKAARLVENKKKILVKNP